MTDRVRHSRAPCGATKVAPYVRHVTLLVLLIIANPALAQDRVDGHIAFLFDYVPNTSDAVELRSRVFAETTLTQGKHVTLKLSGFAEGLLADRNGGRRSGVVRPQDLFIDVAYERFDLRAGFARVVWGRLDEIQPGDVVNPLDIARFFLEGRSEARLPVALARGRWFLPRGTTLEGVLVPAFRRGRFDQLDEPTSPFNLAPSGSICLPRECVPILIERQKPSFGSGSIQGGMRLSATTTRVDWALSAYRGLEPFGVYTVGLPAVVPPLQTRVAIRGASTKSVIIEQTFPRFTMVSGDFETVRGEWAVRGELAVFLTDTFAAPSGLGAFSGRSIESGIGIERKAGEYRLSGNLLFQRQTGDAAIEDTNVSVVLAADRSFSRETQNLRAFGVYNASSGTAFVRGIHSVSLRDNLSLEGSAGWFLGEGTDAIGRFSDRDFLYARLKIYF